MTIISFLFKSPLSFKVILVNITLFPLESPHRALTTLHIGSLLITLPSKVSLFMAYKLLSRASKKPNFLAPSRLRTISFSPT